MTSVCVLDPRRYRSASGIGSAKANVRPTSSQMIRGPSLGPKLGRYASPCRAGAPR